MKILILYDRRSTSDHEVNWLSLLLSKIPSNHRVQTTLLDYREIKPCRGCFGCWTKTPGLCVISDKANLLSREYIGADVVILLSKITYGGYSADIKAFLDRSIVNISPFFKMIHGEMHHKKRYEHYPDLIAFGYGASTEAEGETFVKLLERNALNIHANHSLAVTIEPGTEEEAFRKLDAFLGRRLG